MIKLVLLLAFTCACNAQIGGNMSVGGSVSISGGTGSAACVLYAIQDWSSGSNGTNPAPTDMEASTFGATGSGWTWASSNPASAITYSSTAYKAPSTNPTFCAGGSYSTPATQLGINYSSSLGAGTTNVLRWCASGVSGCGGPMSGSSAIYLASIWFRSSFTTGSTLNCDCFDIIGSGSGGTTFTNAIESDSGAAMTITIEGLVEENPTASASINTNVLTVSSATGIVIGQNVRSSGGGIVAGTKVTGVAGTSVTISNNTTAGLSSQVMSFSWGVPITLTTNSTITSAPWYQLCLLFDSTDQATGAQVVVLDDTGTQIGDTLKSTASNGTPVQVFLGQLLTGPGQSGRVNQFGAMKLCYQSGCTRAMFPIKM